MAEMAVDVADRWSAAPRLGPAVFAGVATSRALVEALNHVTIDPWVQLGVAAAISGRSAAERDRKWVFQDVFDYAHSALTLAVEKDRALIRQIVFDEKIATTDVAGLWLWRI